LVIYLQFGIFPPFWYILSIKIWQPCPPQQKLTFLFFSVRWQDLSSSRR
jgi:hypothetical protein